MHENLNLKFSMFKRSDVNMNLPIIKKLNERVFNLSLLKKPVDGRDQQRRVIDLFSHSIYQYISILKFIHWNQYSIIRSYIITA